MKVSREESAKSRVEELFGVLNNYIQTIKGTDEKRASIAYCIANLLIENCDLVEGLGVLEMVKELLNRPMVNKENMSVDLSLFYVA